MMKPKLCSFQDCEREVSTFPGSKIKKKYCYDHAISMALDLTRKKQQQEKEELDRAKQEVRRIGANKTQKQKALKLADDWFSKYIRLKYSFELNGSFYCECYTCKGIFLMKAMDNGHWQKRENKATRFDLNNARPQCTECNDHRKGEYSKFEQRLIQELGEEEVTNIRQLALSVGEDSELYYREQADKYRNLFNEELKSRDINNPWNN